MASDTARIDAEVKHERLPTLGDYEVHRAWEGFASIRQISSGEIMHSRTDPMEEARKLYVEQSRLAERLQSESLILWDAGLGAAANAMAAIECYEESSRPRPFRIISFENDLDSLRLALANPQNFPYLREDAANAIVTDGEWNHRGLRWRLLPGDFAERMNQAPPPDIIFYDMFSTKTSAELWTVGIFRKIFEACAGRAVELFTYTCSTANRAALLAAGFFVARGRNAGDKIETTIAFTPAALDLTRKEKRDLLGPDWLAKWERSAAKFPSDIQPDNRPAFEKIIRGHEQFRNSATPERLSSTT
jgi:queuine tRNA-ribosyltransferase